MLRSTYLACLLAAGLTSAAHAGPEDLATIERECQAQLGYAPARCACFGETAEAQLSDTQQAFVAAQITSDQVAVAQIQPTMTIDDMVGAGTFMGNVAQLCP